MVAMDFGQGTKLFACDSTLSPLFYIVTKRGLPHQLQHEEDVYPQIFMDTHSAVLAVVTGFVRPAFGIFMLHITDGIDRLVRSRYKPQHSGLSISVPLHFCERAP